MIGPRGKISLSCMMHTCEDFHGAIIQSLTEMLLYIYAQFKFWAASSSSSSSSSSCPPPAPPPLSLTCSCATFCRLVHHTTARRLLTSAAIPSSRFGRSRTRPRRNGGRQRSSCFLCAALRPAPRQISSVSSPICEGVSYTHIHAYMHTCRCAYTELW